MKASYQLGAVPDLTVWTDELLDLQLIAPFDGPAEFALDAPATAGPLVLDSASAQLTYRPAPQDAMPFEVTVVARSTDSARHASQTISITPKPRVAPAVVAFTHFCPPPDPASDAYLEVRESAAGTVAVDGADLDAVAVEVSGVRVVLQPNSDRFPLFRRLHKRGDIASLRVDADEVVVAGHLHLPGTAVTVHARRLEFRDGDEPGCIDTTPTTRAEPARGDEAARGRDAGAVSLLVAEVKASGTAVRVRADGGGGQAARPGQPGAPGADLDPWDGKASTKTYWLGHETLNWSGMFPDDGYTIIRGDIWLFYEPGWNQYVFEGTKGPLTWPGDGSPPRVYPGRPGPGGSGGRVTIRAGSHLADRVSVAAGAPGAKAKRIPPARAGRPVKASWVKAVYQQWIVPKVGGRRSGDGTLNILRSLKVQGRHDAKDGPEGPSLDVNPATPAGTIGAVVEVDDTWLKARALRAVLAFVRDGLIANRVAELRPLALTYLDALENLADPDVTLDALHGELLGLVESCDGPNDYFGYPAGWVPMLSFEANLSRYEAELDASIRALFFAAWVERRQDDAVTTGKALETALDLLEGERQTALATLTAAQARLRDVTVRYDDIHTEIVRLTDRLQNMERDIKRLARDDLQREHALRASGTILAGLMQVIPVGQPALGLAGKGLDIVANMDFDKPLDSASDIAGLSAEIAKQTIVPKVQNLVDSLQESGTSDTTDPKKAKFNAEVAKKELAEKVKAHMDEQKAAKAKIKKAVSGFSVSQEEVDAEFERIAAATPEYQDLVAEIKRVSTRQGRAAAQLMTVLETIDTATATIMNALLGRISLGANLDRAMADLDIEARQAAQGLGQRARDRLLNYQYQLVKSYQYLMVQDAESVDYSMTHLFDAFAHMLGSSDDGTLTDEKLRSLRVVFEDQMLTVTGSILDWYASHPKRDTGTMLVTLTPEQLAALNSGDRETQLDLFTMGYLDPDIEDVRITSIETEAVKLADTPPSGAANVSLTAIHEGEGIVRRSGRLHLFRTGGHWGSDATAGSSGELLDDRAAWRTDVNLLDGVQTVEHSAPSPVEASLLSHLLGRDQHPDTSVLTAFQPPAWATITLRRSATPYSFPGRVMSLTLRIRHEFHRASSAIATVVVRAPNAAKAFVGIDGPDLSGAAGGRVVFLRSYDGSSTQRISLTAPRVHAGKVLLGWRILHRTPEDPNTAMMTVLDPHSAEQVGDASDLVPGPTLTLDLRGGAVVDAVYGTPAARPTG